MNLDFRRLAGKVAEHIVRGSGVTNFKGRGRLITYWLKTRPRDEKRNRVLPGGALMECDLAYDYDCMVFLGQEEEADLRTLAALLGPGDLFVDCGANIGLWTLVASSRVGHSGAVVSFEPNPSTFARLERNIGVLNRFGQRARALPSAVGSEAGNAYFAPDAIHNISRMGSGDGAGLIRVPVTTIDHELEGKQIAGIKIDVEGYELRVLDGARHTIEVCQPWLCIEFNTLLVGNDVLGDWDVDRWLRRRAYAPVLFHEAMSPNSRTLEPSWRTRGYVNLLYRPQRPNRNDNR